MAAFWLAAKLEEVIEIDNPNRLTLRDVIRVVDRVTRRREGKSLTSMDPYSQVGTHKPAAACCWLVAGLADGLARWVDGWFTAAAEQAAGQCVHHASVAFSCLPCCP